MWCDSIASMPHKRSAAGKKKRSQKARKIIREQLVTAGQQRHCPLLLEVRFNCRIVNNRGDILACIFRQTIPKEQLDQLIKSTQVLLENQEPKKETSCRGKDISVYHLGCWRKYAEKGRLTKQTTEFATQWFRTNAKVFEIVAGLFKSNFSELYTTYSNAKMRLAQTLQEHEVTQILGPWCSLALNINFASEIHTDKHDYRTGYCWIVPFGNFIGGALHMKEINTNAYLEAGDCIAFRSYDLLHYVLPYEGVRHSLVLFSHHEMFF